MRNHDPIFGCGYGRKSRIQPPWYASNSTNAGNKTAALAKISEYGNALSTIKTTNATENALIVRDLIEACRVIGDSAYLTSAATVYYTLYTDFNFIDEIFTSQAKYTIDNIGVLLGSVNSVIIYAGDAVNQSQAEDFFTAIYLNLINKSGMQLTAPPLGVGKDKFEQDHPSIYYGYPTLPMSPMTGAEYGIAPVFASEVTYSSGQWLSRD